MSSKSKSTSSTNQTTSSTNQQGGWNQRDVYGPAEGGLNDSLNMQTNWMNDPNSSAVYGGERVAGLSDYTQQGLAGLAGNQGFGQSTDYYSRVLGGEYLNAGNPHMEDMKTSVMNSVMPGINATFGRSGMAGSTIHQNQLANGLGDAMAPHLFANYENERNRQGQAASALPAMYEQQANSALRAGSIQDQHNQNVINADMNAFNEARDRPMAVANSGFGNFLAAGQAFGRNNQESWGNSTGQQNGTTTSSSSPSPFSQIMGAGMMGLGAMTGNPMMAMAGGGQQTQMPSYAPMQAASYGSMNSYNPANNPFMTGY